MAQLWRISIERVQKRFQQAVDDGCALECFLIQSTIPRPTECGSVPGKSEFPTALGSGASRDPKQIFDQEAAERALKHGPILDANGNPILTTAGEPIAIERGFSRRHQYFATVPSAYRRYREIAKDAGVCVAAPVGAHWDTTWAHLPGGSQLARSGEGIWTDAIFELAWQQFGGSPLAASKYAWNGNVSYDLDFLESIPAKEFSFLPRWIRLPVYHWHSFIRNMFVASVAAIDILLAIPDEEITPPSGKNDEPPSQLSELVTLDQMAPLTGLSKRTLERYLREGNLPEPDVRGGGGRSHKWFWSTVREPLSKIAQRTLPEQFPGTRII